MAKVKFFGESRLLLKTGAMDIEGTTIKAIIRNIDKDFDGKCKGVLRNSIIFVNNVNFLDLKRYKTVVGEEDEIVFLSPVAGG